MHAAAPTTSQRRRYSEMRSNETPTRDGSSGLVKFFPTLPNPLSAWNIRISCSSSDRCSWNRCSSSPSVEPWKGRQPPPTRAAVVTNITVNPVSVYILSIVLDRSQRDQCSVGHQNRPSFTSSTLSSPCSYACEENSKRSGVRMRVWTVYAGYALQRMRTRSNPGSSRHSCHTSIPKEVVAPPFVL